MTWLGLALLLAPQAQPVFPVSSEMVRIVVSVTDSAGRPVAGLEPKDFTITEDGKKRDVGAVAQCGGAESQALEDCSVDLVLLLDTSGSMRDMNQKARDAALQFVKQVKSARGRTVIAFDSRVMSHPFDDANPSASLAEALASQGDRGITRFFGAVLEGVAKASSDPGRRAIMVALTDGEDSGRPRGSRVRPVEGTAESALRARQSHPTEEIARVLQRESVTFYAVSFAQTLERVPEITAKSAFDSASMASEDYLEARVDHATATLKALAEASGGLVVDGMAQDLAPEFDRIRNDIAAQYVLGFIPGSSDSGKPHKLKIGVAAKGIKLRYRTSYESR